jgi:hypothetical protein
MVVWYLGYQRYSEMKSTQSSKLLSVVTDASDLPVTDSDGECCGGMTIFAP